MSRRNRGDTSDLHQHCGPSTCAYDRCSDTGSSSSFYCCSGASAKCFKT